MRPRALVVGGLAVFVLGVYVLVVLGGGALIGRTDSPSPALSVLATTVVALAFAPVQGALERATLRIATPYDVLSQFAENIDEVDGTEDLAARMSRLLAQGTGAQWAQVWLLVSGRLTLAGRWPREPDGVDVGAGVRRTLPVQHGHQVLGELRLQERPGLPLTAVEERLFDDLASQAGLVLRLVGLRAELADRHRDLTARTVELESSRARLIETQDAERSRLERDIHDGAQQHLVALVVNLRLVQVVAARSPGRANQMLTEQVGASRLAIETLSSLSRGIYPRLLSEQGLVAALTAGVATGSIPVTFHAETAGRPDALLEAALYFCCMEAIQNAAKHSGAATVSVRLSQVDGCWRLDVSDDGSGFDQTDALSLGRGAGLMNMHDRLDAIGGRVTITSEPGCGTTVSAVGPPRQDG